MKNHRRTVFAVLVSAFVIGALVAPAGAHYRKANGNRVSKKHARMHRQQKQQGTTQQTTDFAPAGLVATGGDLKMFSATVDGGTLQELVNEGYDVTPTDDSLEGIDVALVLSAGERKALEAKGVELTFQSAPREREARAALSAADQSIYGFDVYRSYDEPGGIEDQIVSIGTTPQNRGFTNLFDIGDTIEGRDIWAIRMTQGARGLPLGNRPAVLFQATTHAREWISTEVGMRLLEWFVAERRAENPEVVEILETTELWFLPVVNPDGYEYTFTDERLWRKNLRDNDGNTVIDNNDGVDLNRNYAEHWNYDEEGSNSPFTSETYRGTGPGSEPEAAADMNLVKNMADFKFAISYHSFGQLLLYPQGWQTLTMTADDPIYMALSGTDDDPAIEDFNPGVGADLYTTNGEFTDWAHGEENVLSWTPELSQGCESEPECGFGFEFPDDEALVQAEFERNLDFAVNVAKSAGDPDDPESHTGLDTQGLYLNEAAIDPWKTNWSQSDLRVDVSYAGGSSQPVEVLAKKDLGAVTLHYTVNGGLEQTGLASPSPQGDIYGGNNAYNTYYQYLRGDIGPLAEGDSVEYWFTGGGEETEHATFDVEGDATADVLILSAEDYTGASPGQDPAGPHYLSFYTDAVDDAARTFEVYDVDAMGRKAPDHLGVLSHYDTVIWYRGDDIHVREPGWGGFNMSRLYVDELLAVREYLNHGGNLLYTGQFAGATENNVAGAPVYYDPVANQMCVTAGVLTLARCLRFDDKNDFLQYYLGDFIHNISGGIDPATGEPFPVDGTDTPYLGASWEFNGADSGQNQFNAASFLTTSSLLPPDEYPQFTSDARANYDRGTTAGGNAFAPFDGDWYWYSQQADVSFKRLGRTFTVPPAGGNMTFQISYDTEQDWDFVFVEVHTVVDRGAPSPEWTTLPDANLHNSQSTGPDDPDLASCPAGWHELHPHLAHYQTWDGVGACDPTGTTGEWWASSGRSNGWEDWSVDLAPFAEDDVEIFISYASDWAIQGLGSFVDFVQLPGEAVESFETGEGAWSPSQPSDSAPNPNNWLRTEDVGFEEGAVVSMTPSTADLRTLFFGFGFEGITGATTREDVMDRSLDFLGV
jgi:Zinc carboxypeptidase